MRTAQGVSQQTGREESLQFDHGGTPRLEMDALLPSEWNRLVRLCASLSGNVDTADDLAQETLIEAWRNAEKLQNPDLLADHQVLGIKPGCLPPGAHRLAGRTACGQITRGASQLVHRYGILLAELIGMLGLD